jgi:hypothetical protein
LTIRSDDEADNASSGYLNDREPGLQLRTIAEQMDGFRHDLHLSSFLQVTATPYSLYLQPEGEPIPGASLMPVRPRFTKLVPVHSDYVRGDSYFENARNHSHPAYYVFYVRFQPGLPGAPHGLGSSAHVRDIFRD